MLTKEKIFLGGALILALAACQSNERETGTTRQDSLIISLQNRSHQVVTQVVMFDVTDGHLGAQAVLRHEDMYLQSGVDQVIFIPDTKQCMFVMRIEYLNGYNIDMPAQDFCQRSTLILYQKDGKPPISLG